MDLALDIRPIFRSARWLPLLFGAVVLVVGLYANDYEYDTDEGINLMKSVLLSQGHPLYTSIWSDQPPAFTYALSGWFKVFGPSVNGARVLVLATSILLLVSLQQTLRILENDRFAAVAVALLAGANWYALYSFSVMIGLPALAIGTSAVWLAAICRKRGTVWLGLAAGAVLGVSIHTKAFTILMLPMILALLVAPLGETLDRVFWRKRLLAAGLCCVGLGAALAFIGVLTGTDLAQLTQTHLRASELDPDTAISPVLTLMRRDWMVAVLGSTSLLLINRSDAWRHLLPFLWFATAGIVLHNHWPVWRHHGLLLMIPAAWAAARTVTYLWDIVQRQPLTAMHNWARVAIGIVVLWCGFTAVRALYRLVEGEPGPGPRMTALLERYASSTDWVYTDRLMLAYRAGLPVPPPLAVVSVKRQRAGELSDAALVGILEEYEPAQLLLGRLSYGPAFHAYVDQHYTLSYRSKRNVGPGLQHYLRNDPRPTSAPTSE